MLAQQRQQETLKMGATRRVENGIIPPTKEVHHIHERRNADFYRRSYAHSLYGSNATL
jgi:hypothetical protein